MFMPPVDAGKTRSLGQGVFDVWRGELPPLLPGGAGEVNELVRWVCFFCRQVVSDSR
jgi:hypothetical protein